MNPSGLADSPLFHKSDDLPISNTNGDQEKNMVQGNHQYTMPPSNHDTSIELIRKAVKSVGKEAATYRLTKKEKQELFEIIYAYRSQGTKISENEIARIAINYLIIDYKSNSMRCILQEVIEALNQ
jgi:hypothetical protein